MVKQMKNKYPAHLIDQDQAVIADHDDQQRVVVYTDEACLEQVLPDTEERDGVSTSRRPLTLGRVLLRARQSSERGELRAVVSALRSGNSAKERMHIHLDNEWVANTTDSILWGCHSYPETHADVWKVVLEECRKYPP